MDRLTRLSQHLLARGSSEEPPRPSLASSPTSASLCAAGASRSEDDVVICSALRTPIGRARRGNFRDTPCEELLVPLFRQTFERTKLDPKAVGDVQIGNALQPGAGGITSRAAQFLAGMPCDVPLASVNRQCSSGLQAVANIAAAIRCGIIDVGLAGGVESMSNHSMAEGVDFNKLSSQILDNEMAGHCLMPMGLTSENVAARYGIGRETQDRMAAESHRRAIAAQKEGLYDDEIVPVATQVKDAASGKVMDVVVKKDEGPRAGTSEQGLAKLKPAFRAGGSTTAGNSSQVSDGAAMVLLARRSAAQRLGLPVLARLRSFAVVGVDPAFMGIGPAFAIPVAVQKAGLTLDDIDIFEINEAFASQCAMTMEHLKLPMEKVNPKGGAIALGHPLGCTGARQVATLLPELRRRGGRLGVVSMCMGTGMGAAAVIESEQ